MKKIVYFDKNAWKEFIKLNEKVQDEFSSYIDVLATLGYLNYPDAKKINANLFEIRVKVINQWRCFYSYISDNEIILLRFFKKKTQKTPLNEIYLAKKRQKSYEK